MAPEELVRRIATASSILLTSHASPDGDAIGSELGFARALQTLGKRTLVWNADATPTVYAALPGAELIHSSAEPPAGFPHSFDLGIVLECPSLERTRLEAHLALLDLVNIDHHLGNTGYGVSSWVDPEMPAVGVMVAELCSRLGAQVDELAASCLLLALVTDTGGFRFANATPAAFQAAAALVEAGAGVERVSHWLYERRPEGAVRLLGELLATVERHADGRIATAHLTLAAFSRAAASAGDSEGLIDVPRSIDGVDVVALLREVGQDEWKVSLRSRGAVDVEQIARAHQGGGHRNAAGCSFRGTLAVGQAQFVEKLRRLIGERE